jgi:hypothetical protein
MIRALLWAGPARQFVKHAPFAHQIVYQLCPKSMKDGTHRYVH